MRAISKLTPYKHHRVAQERLKNLQKLVWGELAKTTKFRTGPN